MDSINFLWVVLCGCFVFFMQAGFVCYEVGFVQAKNVVSVAIENIGTFVITTLIFGLWGFGLMFGSSFHGLWGNGYWLLSHLSEATNPLHSAYTFFQLMFISASVTIFSGSMSERTRLGPLLVADLVVAGFIYPMFAHWVWGGSYSGIPGWLQHKGFIDFAGATVVHATAGWIALAGTIVVGPRRGRFVNGRVQKLGHSNIPFAALGTFILWFSWFGFNGGSLLRFDERVALILLNTNFAAAAGVLGALLTVRLFLKDQSYMEAVFAGALGGLVAITAGSNILTPLSSVLVGLVAGTVVIASGHVLQKMQIDDAVGAAPIHAFGGAAGALMVPLLADLTLLPIGSRLGQMAIQLVGVLVNLVWAFGLGMVMFHALDKAIGLRVTPEDEVKGLNIVEFADIYSWDTFLKTRKFESVTRHLNSRIRQQNMLLKRQARLLVATQEQERRELGRDLHDGVGQSLAAAKLQVSMLAQKLRGQGRADLAGEAQHTRDQLDIAINEIRSTIFNLRPTLLQERGLLEALFSLAASVRQSTELKVEVELGHQMPDWDETVELNIYRIVQECLSNIMKHAEASTVKITGKPKSTVYQLTIYDDGVGFILGEAKNGIGLTSMRERVAVVGGNVTIVSQPGQGTEVVLEVPLEKDSRFDRR